MTRGNRSNGSHQDWGGVELLQVCGRRVERLAPAEHPRDEIAALEPEALDLTMPHNLLVLADEVIE